MTIFLLFGAVLGALVLAGSLPYLVFRLATWVVFPKSRVLDPPRIHVSGLGLGFDFAGSLLGLLMLTLHPGPIMEKLGAAGFVVASLWFLGRVVEWLRQRRHLGPRLMSVRPHMGCLVLLPLISGYLLWIGISALMWPAPDNTLHVATTISAGLFWFTVAVEVPLRNGLAQFELRVRGCLTFIDHATWAELESYRWKAGHGDWLTLELKARHSSVPAMSVVVPLAKKQPIDDILKQHVPDASAPCELAPPD